MEASSDLERLGTMLSLPAGVTDARWVLERLGEDSFMPGPTDLRLVALLHPGSVLGERDGEQSFTLSTEAAEALLGAAPGNEIRGQAYDASALSTASFRVSTALRAGDAVLVAAISS